MDFFKKCFSDKKHSVLAVLVWVLAIFIAMMTISSLISIINKIKENKYIGQDIEIRNTIAVSESAESYAKPDLAVVGFSVQNEAKTVDSAMKKNSEIMNQVIADIKAQGVEDKDLKTTNFSINPRYEYYTSRDDFYSSGKRVLAAYEIVQSLQVKIRDLDKIGSIIQTAADAGANQVGSLQFAIDQEEELKNQVREEAIRKAKDKAEAIAEQLGVDLVRIISFNESSESPWLSSYKTMEMGIGGGGDVPTIETGENKIETTVTIIYEIN